MTHRALITGATGLLGSYIVRRALDAEYQVRVLVRDIEKASWLRAMGAELVVGDVRDAGSVIAAAAGCDVVFHAAALVGTGTAWQPFQEINVAGTEAVVRASAAAGARLVHVSSTSVYGDRRYEMVPVHEDVTLPVLPARDAYGRSKQEAERVVMRAHERGEVWATAIRPPILYGERDRQFIPRIAPIIARGVFPLFGGGGTTLPMVHANSVAEGALCAARADGAAGRVYNLTTDFPVTVRELLRYAADGLERRVFTPTIPVSAGKPMFALLGVALRLVGRADLAGRSAGTLRMLTRDNPFVSERARAELAWKPTLRPEVGISEALRWWRRHHERR